MLILQRKAGESLIIGGDITVRVVSVDGVRVRLAITAPEDRERPSLPIISPPAMAPERPLPLDS